MHDHDARRWAAIIAAAALLGMVPPLQYHMAEGQMLAGAVWMLLRAFTITTNLLIAITFILIVMRGPRRVAPAWVANVMLALVLVGVVFNLVLGQIPQYSWWGRIGDSLHHHVLPIAVPLWWWRYGTHGTLRWSTPFAFALYPLVYAAYLFVRAGLEPAGTPFRYPYFFLDVDRLGWSAVLANVSMLAAGFVLAGFALVWLDRRLARAGAERR
jgi:hypothetical protein